MPKKSCQKTNSLEAQSFQKLSFDCAPDNSKQHGSCEKREHTHHTHSKVSYNSKDLKKEQFISDICLQRTI